MLPAGAYDEDIADPGRLASLGRAVGAIRKIVDDAHGVARRARARVTDEDIFFFPSQKSDF